MWERIESKCGRRIESKRMGEVERMRETERGEERVRENWKSDALIGVHIHLGR